MATKPKINKTKATETQSVELNTQPQPIKTQTDEANKPNKQLQAQSQEQEQDPSIEEQLENMTELSTAMYLLLKTLCADRAIVKATTAAFKARDDAKKLLAKLDALEQ